MRFATAQASSRSRVRISAPRAFERRRDDFPPRHLRRAACRWRLPPRPDSLRPGDSRIACADSSCSACEKRSIATQSAGVAAVGDHQDLGGPGDHVDADLAEHLALGLGDVGVARADDLVDARRSFRCRRRARRSPARRRCAITRSTPASAAAASTSGFGFGLAMTSSRTPGHLRRHRVHQHRRRDTPPCRRARRGRRARAASPAGRGACRRPRCSPRTSAAAARGTRGCARAPRAAPAACSRRDGVDAASSETSNSLGRRTPSNLLRVLEHRRVAALAHVGEDRCAPCFCTAGSCAAS